MAMNESNPLDRCSASDHRRLRRAGAIWICAVQFFIAQVVVQWRWTTPYSLAGNYISDLGNTSCGIYLVSGSYVCSPWHGLMNVSFALQGIIIALGTLYAAHCFTAGVRCWLVALLGATAIGMLGVGLFPEDVNHGAHVLCAGTQFITGNGAMLLFGLAARGDRRWQRLAGISVCFGLLGLVATGLFANGYGLGLGVGGMERVAAYTLPLWLMRTGAWMLRHAAAATPAANM